MVTPYGIQAPEDIAKEYGGNKQKIMAAAQTGIIDPTAAVMAGMFIDRMRSAAQQEAAPAPSTVAQDTFAPPMPPAGGLGAMPQAAPPMPAQMGPQMGAPAPQGMPPAQGGIGGLDFAPAQMAGGGIVGYNDGGILRTMGRNLPGGLGLLFMGAETLYDKGGEEDAPVPQLPSEISANTVEQMMSQATPDPTAPARTSAPRTAAPRTAAPRTAAPVGEELDPYSVTEVNPSRGVEEQMTLRTKYMGEPEHRNQVMEILAKRMDPKTLERAEKRDRALFLFELGASLAAGKSPYLLQNLGEAASGAMSKAEEREAARDKSFLDNAMAMADMEGITRNEAQAAINAGVQSELARAGREDVVKGRIAARDLAREEMRSREGIAAANRIASTQPKPRRMARPEDFLSDAIKLVEIGTYTDEGMQERIKAAGGPTQLAQNMAEEMANRANSYRGTGSGSGQGETLRFDENGNLIP